ncbi:MAG: DUF4276 family protein [Leptospirales bacterium]
MHFEILVEDQSGKKMLDILVPKIIDNQNTFRVHSYKGIGRIPNNIGKTKDARKRILLDRLPHLLRGYGRSFNYPAAVILVCDLDNRCLHAFRQDLFKILNECDPMPETRFCLAIEEGEAWFLGDINAVKSVYPKAKDAVLSDYVNDSICGTWEHLANAVFPGGAQSLSAKGWQSTGTEKSVWAEKITPHMDIENNNSPSFCYFRDKLRELVLRKSP